MYYYFEVLKKFAKFSGRARRSEYWYFCIANIVVIPCIFLFIYIINWFGLFNDNYEVKSNIAISIILGYLTLIIIPYLALCVRRLHDIGKSGFMILINLIPYIGIIWFIILLFREGTYGNNEYGPDPKFIFKDEVDVEISKEKRK